MSAEYGCIYRRIVIVVVTGFWFGLACLNGQEFPENHSDLTQPVPYRVMAEYLEGIADPPFITVDKAGKSVEGRHIYRVHLQRGKQKKTWRVLFYAQQHGNEPAGKDALLYLIRYIRRDPGLLPVDVDLWIMPMVNPDGAEADQRRNANDFDLNRDHILLSQPETRALHMVYREIMPHVAVDCHEFSRDSEDYSEKGWREWPLIMMDCSNNPLFYPRLYDTGVRWCEQVKPFMEKEGHNYTRYHVGGVPPDEEQRFSSMDIDDGRNGLGTYEGLSFIIESGILRNSGDPNTGLSLRVGAYLDLLQQFLHERRYRKPDIRTVEDARLSPVPPFIPTNYFWGNHGSHTTDVRVIDKKSGEIRNIPTANFMVDRIVKKSVSTPAGYIIDASSSELYRSLLNRHGIYYESLEKPALYTVEPCTLISVEDEYDELYARYAGRQIVKKGEPVRVEFKTGAVYVPLTQKAAKRVILLLEPLQLYGLYRYPEFYNTVHNNGVIPVMRIIPETD